MPSQGNAVEDEKRDYFVVVQTTPPDHPEGVI
jgi:hypothetical protein